MIQNAAQEYIILLGGNILNSGIAYYCRKHRKKIIVVDWDKDTFIKGDLFLCIDIKDSCQIIKALKENQIDNICGVYSSIDLALHSVNAINKEYGLSYIDDETILHVISKSAMTNIWNKSGLLNRTSKLFNTYHDDILNMSKNFKLIFKPNVSSSSRGITIVGKGSSPSVLQSAFKKAQTASFDSKVIIEEFVEGREFTCEMLGDKYGNICVYAVSVKYHTKNTINNKIATKLHYNSDSYPNDVYLAIAEIGKKCYKALGLKSSFGHLEIIMKNDGTFSPVEIGARSSGFIAFPLVSLASGSDFFGDYLKVLSGEKIKDSNYLNGNISSMYFFYDMPNETHVVTPCCLIDFLPDTIKSEYSNRSKVLEKGFKFTNINNDNERVGYEIIYGERHQMKIEVIEEAERMFIKNNTKYELL